MVAVSIFLVIVSLSHCGGKSSAKMEVSKTVIKEIDKEKELINKRNKYLEEKDRKQTEELNKTKQNLELLIYRYEQLKKKGVVVPKRNLDNADGDSLYRIWKRQLEGQH